MIISPNELHRKYQNASDNCIRYVVALNKLLKYSLIPENGVVLITLGVTLSKDNIDSLENDIECIKKDGIHSGWAEIRVKYNKEFLSGIKESIIEHPNSFFSFDLFWEFVINYNRKD